MSNLRSENDLDAVVTALARRALLMNAVLGLGTTTAMLPGQLHPVLTAASRVLELSTGKEWYAGTRRQPATPLSRMALDLFADHARHPGSGLHVKACPRRSPHAEGPLDNAVVLLAQRAQVMIETLWRGGPTSQLPKAIHPVIAALRVVDAQWQDRALFTPVAGIPLKPAAQLAGEVEASIDPEKFARWCRDDERRARRERGLPENVELPVATTNCPRCRVQSGDRHTSIDCIPPGEEVLLTLTAWPGLGLLGDERLSETNASIPTAELRGPMRAPACGACGRGISPSGHCGC